MPRLILLVFLGLAPVVHPSHPLESGWRPIPGPVSSLGPSPTPIGPTALIPRTFGFPSRYTPHQHRPQHTRPNPVCTLYKATFDQHMFQQYIQYKTQVPDLKEFTLCLWHRFYNHTPEQPLFSYAHRDKPREIYSWVANTDSSSYYMLAINGQTMYRLNYPCRLHKWYHMCQSWNGKTGEWQIWVNAERIGRGFHNLLVGKPVRSGGMAVSGQQVPSQPAPPGVLRSKVAGLQGEITLVQLYKAALTAGKAYTNHKHHHVHHFHHEDKKGEDDYEIDNPSPPSPPSQPAQSQGTQFPFLSSGQLVPMLPINELSAFRDPGLGLFTPFNNLRLPGPQRLFKRDQSKLTATTNKRVKKSEESNSEEDEDEEEEHLASEDILKVTSHESKKVKRDTSKEDITQSKTVTEEDVLGESDDKESDMKKRQTLEDDPGEDKNQKKRTLFNDQFQFGLVPGDDLSGLFPGNGYILGGGGVKFDAAESGSPQPTQSVQMEPAEWEVRSIMEVCSGCSEDPFRKANIISWRETPKKLFAGAQYVVATPECQRF